MIFFSEMKIMNISDLVKIRDRNHSLLKSKVISQCESKKFSSPIVVQSHINLASCINKTFGNLKIFVIFFKIITFRESDYQQHDLHGKITV